MFLCGSCVVSGRFLVRGGRWKEAGERNKQERHDEVKLRGQPRWTCLGRVQLSLEGALQSFPVLARTGREGRVGHILYVGPPPFLASFLTKNGIKKSIKK